MTEVTLFLVFSWLLAAAFLVVLPRFWHRSPEGESVDDWLAIRQVETDDADLLADAELRVWDDQDAALDSGTLNHLHHRECCKPSLYSAFLPPRLLCIRP